MIKATHTIEAVPNITITERLFCQTYSCIRSRNTVAQIGAPNIANQKKTGFLDFVWTAGSIFQNGVVPRFLRQQENSGDRIPKKPRQTCVNCKCPPISNLKSETLTPDGSLSIRYLRWLTSKNVLDSFG